MALSSFVVRYRFARQDKEGDLAAWLADSLDGRFGGDLGLIQTTRLAVHQTKVRLLAASIDAVEAAERRTIALDEVNAGLVGRGLRLCVERHRAEWEALAPGKPTPSFAYAFELFAADPAEPAFLQCPVPDEANKVDQSSGLKLLPDYGFAVPSQLAAAGDCDLAFQLMAYAGKLSYVRGQPTSSRPLDQAVAIDVPGKPAWRVRHELETTLGRVDFGREALKLRGAVTFAWLLPFLPNGKPIPRGRQHPLLLDVCAPIRVGQDRRVSIYNRPFADNGKELALPAAALSFRNAWAAAGLPGLPLAAVQPRPTRGKSAQAGAKDAAVAAAGLDPSPAITHRPFGKVPGSKEILGLVSTAQIGGQNDELGVPVLGIYRGEGNERFELPEGAELVVEGALIGVSTTTDWLQVRVPLPDPAQGADSLPSRWASWQKALHQQLEMRKARLADLRFRAEKTWLRRRQVGEGLAPRRVKARAGEFARRWTDQVEAETEAAFWSVAAQTWREPDENKAQWSAVLNRAVHVAAGQAFDALGGFDDTATVLAAADRKAGLLGLVRDEAGARSVS